MKIDASQIADWDAFHAVFKAALGFPDFYGCNMNAWIDCLTSLDSPGAGMTNVHADEPAVLALAFSK